VLQRTDRGGSGVRIDCGQWNVVQDASGQRLLDSYDRGGPKRRAERSRNECWRTRDIVGRNFRKLAENKITAYVALGREGRAAKNILPSTENPHTQAMEQRLRREEGQRWYRQRKWLAEPPFGWIKHVLGFSALQLAGPQESARRVAIGLHGTQSEENLCPKRRLIPTKNHPQTRMQKKNGPRT